MSGAQRLALSCTGDAGFSDLGIWKGNHATAKFRQYQEPEFQGLFPAVAVHRCAAGGGGERQCKAPG